LVTPSGILNVEVSRTRRSATEAIVLSVMAGYAAAASSASTLSVRASVSSAHQNVNMHVDICVRPSSVAAAIARLTGELKRAKADAEP